MHLYLFIFGRMHSSMLFFLLIDFSPLHLLEIFHLPGCIINFLITQLFVCLDASVFRVCVHIIITKLSIDHKQALFLAVVIITRGTNALTNMVICLFPSMFDLMKHLFLLLTCVDNSLTSQSHSLSSIPLYAPCISTYTP